MKILFLDPVCPSPYSRLTLDSAPLGGTEATVIRVAEALAKVGHIVSVRQHNRDMTVVENKVVYSPFGSDNFTPTHVVLLRRPDLAMVAKQQFPSAKVFCWFHDLVQGSQALYNGAKKMEEADAIGVAVSNFHQTQIRQALQSVDAGRMFYVHMIYNPIDDDLKPDNTPVDPDKYVFFSSPHKGLKETLEIFARFKDFPELKDSKLYIANPGYFPDMDVANVPNVVNLGPLSHPEVIKHVRSAQAVLHLNRVYPETFGLVHAESNAVGTPWVSSGIGANYELTDHTYQVIDDWSSPKEVIDRLILWRTKGRIRVGGGIQFRMSKVVQQWIKLLESV